MMETGEIVLICGSILGAGSPITWREKAAAASRRWRET